MNASTAVLVVGNLSALGMGYVVATGKAPVPARIAMGAGMLLGLLVAFGAAVQDDPLADDDYPL